MESERSVARLTDEHLRRLAEIATADRVGMFRRNPRLSVYGERLLTHRPMPRCSAPLFRWRQRG